MTKDVAIGVNHSVVASCPCHLNQQNDRPSEIAWDSIEREEVTLGRPLPRLLTKEFSLVDPSVGGGTATITTPQAWAMKWAA